MGPRLKAYLQLCRPANLPTAAADIFAGLSISGMFTGSGALEIPSINFFPAFLLILASVFLYAGGVVLNDVFDIKIDKIERPERPIPSGVVPLGKAIIFGFVLLLIGICLAFLTSRIGGIVSILLAIAILSYNRIAKHHSILGPLNMGVCRGLNLFMGITMLNTFESWPYVLIPIMFIYVVTMVSRGEVHGENKTNIILAGFLYTLVLSGVFYLHHIYAKNNYWYLMFLLLFAIMVFAPLVRAYRENTPANIKKAVKSGVLSIILLDAAIAVAHSNLIIGFLILILLPLSIYLAKQFAVT